MRSLLSLAALVLLAAAAAPPRATPPNADEAEARRDTPPWAKTWLGRWSLYEDGEGGQGCTLYFEEGVSIGGAALRLTPTCRQNFPLEDVAGWTLSDPRAKSPRIIFIDALRKPVLTFEKLGAAWAASPRSRGDGLDRPAALLERDTDKPVHESIRHMMREGGFNLSGPDKKDGCGFTTTATRATAGKLSQEGRCARRWKGRGWASWAWTDGKLLLKDREGAVLVTLTREDEHTFFNGSSSDPLFFGPGGIQMS